MIASNLSILLELLAIRKHSLVDVKGIVFQISSLVKGKFLCLYYWSCMQPLAENMEIFNDAILSV